jgi:enamine deaminase RidA (YjgF/YER057c/UK114 family)
MNRSLLILTALLLSGCAAVKTPPQATCFHGNEALERDIGFCQALRSGNTLHISGVTASGPMDSAIRSVYTKLRKVLAANGLSPSNVVKENVYATDLDAFIQNRNIRKEFYGQSLPAATWVQVQRLYRPAFVLEVELTAEYPR